MHKRLRQFDRIFISELHTWSVPTLRMSLGIVFLWFGALKVIGLSPVADFIRATYGFLPLREFMMLLGVWEVAIGVGLIFKLDLRLTLGLLWVQMAGTLFSAVLRPSLFFENMNPLLLTLEGEFVVKNLVLIAAGLVIAGYQVRPKRFSD